MDVPISRRDFFDGIAVGCVAATAAPSAAAPARAAQEPSGPSALRTPLGVPITVRPRHVYATGVDNPFGVARTSVAS
ncbi:hypothetical protein AB0K67_19815 [Nonomuraea sp. NPDC052634]|uniref:hypothetical protein n=1 Tax=Nonomuraea sp. NPDC052634 TaxID=3155813 RepID=UPI003439DE74